MVSQLRTFAAEVTRVALEVGTEGILGGQATVEGVQGVWADLTTNVNVRSLFPTINLVFYILLTPIRAPDIEHGSQSH